MLVLLEFVVQPIATLIHELGHAVAAKRLGGRQVFLVVGRGPWATFSLGSIRVNFSPFNLTPNRKGSPGCRRIGRRAILGPSSG